MNNKIPVIVLFPWQMYNKTTVSQSGIFGNKVNDNAGFKRKRMDILK